MATAAQLEAAWLSASGDGLPALLAADGGPWDTVQAYWPRTPEQRKRVIYVMRGQLDEDRVANQRKRQAHQFRLRLVWPIGSSTTSMGLWEAEQAALDDAVDQLVARIRGFGGDHTHGGAFLSVAEAPAPPRISVQFDDPARMSIGTSGWAQLGAAVTYAAHSRDLIA